MVRDLVQELQQRKSASASSGSVANPKAKARPAEGSTLLAPTANTKQAKTSAEVDAWQIRADLDEAYFTHLDALIVLDAGNEFQDEVLEAGDATQCKQLQDFQGGYFLTGQIVNDYPVWKQCFPTEHAVAPLYWFRGGAGRNNNLPIGW